MADDATPHSPRGRRSFREVAAETGTTREEYVAELVETSDGKLTQQEICSRTGWSSSTVSRVLQRMERSESVVRIRIGREKLVFVPEAAPATEFDEEAVT